MAEAVDSHGAWVLSGRRTQSRNSGLTPSSTARACNNLHAKDGFRTTGQVRRHHLQESVLQRAVKSAARRSGVSKLVTYHGFRHSFATNLLADEYDIRKIQESLVSYAARPAG
ncbi:MAG: tyrosine-type recombinase/integrase [Gemmatimonadaceae bacterium]